ncbi:MAG TPA: hypothetical protein VIF64_08625 [Pyrinomonadaceae bacterium]
MQASAHQFAHRLTLANDRFGNRLTPPLTQVIIRVPPNVSQKDSVGTAVAEVLTERGVTLQERTSGGGAQLG